MSIEATYSPDHTWDVFMSYSSPDREAVEAVAMWLEDEAHLLAFFDRWRLVAGGDAQDGLEQALGSARCVAVFLGCGGLGPWQTEEVRAAVRRAVSGQELRVIPVLLPGADVNSAPDFLLSRTWCELGTSQGAYRLGLESLRSAIRGEAPGRPADPRLPDWLAVVAASGLDEPTGVAVEGHSVFLADRGNGRVLKIETGRLVAELPGLDHPHHVVVDDRQVIICDTHADRIVGCDLNLRPIWDRHRGVHRGLSRPHGLCWLPERGLLVANTDRNELEWVPVPAKQRQAPTLQDLGLQMPCGVGASTDAVFIADTFNHRVVVLDEHLCFVHEFGSRGFGRGEFAYPVAAACWRRYVAIADEHSQRLQLWRCGPGEDGWTSCCLTPDLLGPLAGSPFGLAFDRFGVLHVADRRRGRVLAVDLAAWLKRRRRPSD
jgi:hypothetical protein